MDLKIREELKLYRVIPGYIDALRDKNNVISDLAKLRVHLSYIIKFD